MQQTGIWERSSLNREWLATYLLSPVQNNDIILAELQVLFWTISPAHILWVRRNRQTHKQTRRLWVEPARTSAPGPWNVTRRDVKEALPYLTLPYPTLLMYTCELWNYKASLQQCSKSEHTGYTRHWRNICRLPHGQNSLCGFRDLSIRLID